MNKAIGVSFFKKKLLDDIFFNLFKNKFLKSIKAFLKSSNLKPNEYLKHKEKHTQRQKIFFFIS